MTESCLAHNGMLPSRKSSNSVYSYDNQIWINECKPPILRYNKNILQITSTEPAQSLKRWECDSMDDQLHRNQRVERWMLSQYQNGTASVNPLAIPPTTPLAPGGRSILEECLALDDSMNVLESRLQALLSLHRRVLHDQASIPELDEENAKIMAIYRELSRQLKSTKSRPAALQPYNASQVGRVGRRLKKAINDYQQLEYGFRKQIQEQQARQYRIVFPDASEEEIRAAVEDGCGQIFQQALLNSDRTGNVRSTLGAVRARHDEVQRIEQTMIELAQLFQDLYENVMEKEPAFVTIEQKGEEVGKRMVVANKQLGKGIMRYV